METIIYFVRHAESIYVEGKERSRGLSEVGKSDSLMIRDLLKGEEIDLFISSPYERSLATIRPTANEYSKEIKVEEDLRERSMGQFQPVSFMKAKQQIYEDKQFSFPHGESSLEAQQRAVKIIDDILEIHKGNKIVIGTHGDIMTLMMNHYDKKFDFDFWQSTSMPDIYKVSFVEKRLISSTRLW